MKELKERIKEPGLFIHEVSCLNMNGEGEQEKIDMRIAVGKRDNMHSRLRTNISRPGFEFILSQFVGVLLGKVASDKYYTENSNNMSN